MIGTLVSRITKTSVAFLLLISKNFLRLPLGLTIGKIAMLSLTIVRKDGCTFQTAVMMKFVGCILLFMDAMLWNIALLKRSLLIQSTMNSLPTIVSSFCILKRYFTIPTTKIMTLTG